MTTILKAVQEIEARAGAAPPPATTSRDERPGTASRVLVRVLLALCVGIAIGAAAVAVHTSRPAPPAPAPAEPAHEAAHVAAPPAHAAAPHPRDPSSATIADATRIHSGQPARDAVAPEEQPWGRVEKKSAAGDAPRAAAVEAPSPHAPAAELQSRPADARGAAMPARRSNARAAEAPSRRSGAAAHDDARANARAAAGAHQSSGWTPAGVRVEVTAIDSADNAGGRTATLRIGDRTVTLRQGESASGLEVQLIRPDAVYLRSGRDIFAVDAPPSRR